MADTDFTQKISADPTGFEAGWKRAVASAQASSSAITTQFKGISDSIGLVTKTFAGFAAALAGGAALKKFLDATVEWNAEALKMSQRLGVSTQQASILNVALHHLGIESETYNSAASKLSKQIQGNAQAFEVMGVKVKDATGAYRPVTDVMQEVNEKLIALKNPIAQNIAGQQVYGKGWDEVRAILKITKQGMEDAEVEARKLGLIVGPEGAAMAKRYTEQMRDVGLVTKSLEIQVGNRLLPVFIELGKVTAENVTPAVKGFQTVLETVAVLAANVAFVFGGVGREIGAIGAQMALLMHPSSWGKGGWTAISDAVKADGEAARAELTLLENKLMGIKTGDPYLANAKGKGEAAHGPGADPMYHFKQKGEGGKDPSRMAEWEAALAERKAALEQQGLLEGQFREMSKADEAKYWADLLSMQGLSDQERIALTRKTAEAKMAGIKNDFEVQVATLHAEAAAFKNNTDERMRLELQIQAKYQQGTKEYAAAAKAIVEIQRQAADQGRQIRESRVQAERDADLQTLTLAQQTAQTALHLGLITDTQMLAAERQFEIRRTAIAREALQARKADLKNPTLNPDGNPIEVEKVNRALEALEQQHQVKMGEIRGRMTTTVLSPITDTFRSIQASWSSLIGQLLSGTLTIGGFIKGIFVTAGEAIIQTLSNIAAKWAVNALLEKVLTKTTALSQISANAGVAGAAATASAAAIPFYGWAIAPEAGIAAAAAAMSFTSFLSAAGGFDIPGNINPIVQTHAREMILPAKLADQVRGMTSGGGGETHLHVHAVDAESVKRLFQNNGAALVDVLQKQHRNFAFG